MTKLFYKKQIILAFNNVPELVDTMDDMYTALKAKLQPYSHRVIVCHLVGLDILTHNISRQKNDGLLIVDYPQMQRIVNKAMSFINRSIDSINMSSNVIGPWIEDTIHANIHGKKVHKYLGLHDGLHPDTNTLKLWAKKLMKAFTDNQ